MSCFQNKQCCCGCGCGCGCGCSPSLFIACFNSMALVNDIIPFNMKHNAESDACDLLMEVDRLSQIKEFISEDNVSRVSSYVLSCAEYFHDQEERDRAYHTIFDCHMKTSQYPDALRVSLKLNDKTLVKDVFAAAKDP